MSSHSNPFPGKLFRPHDAIENITGDLPHWRQEGVVYFVTFRLSDSLPEEKLSQWRKERDDRMLRHADKITVENDAEYHVLFSSRLEAWLDAGAGSCLLRRNDCREIVEKALKHFDGQRYRLGEHVVAANHVHAVVTPSPGHTLSGILHSWKSFTAKGVLNAIGPEAGRLRHFAPDGNAVWQRETYDHIVRSPEALHRIGEYIRAHREWRP